jgi:hypothetical protein
LLLFEILAALAMVVDTVTGENASVEVTAAKTQQRPKKMVLIDGVRLGLFWMDLIL